VRSRPRSYSLVATFAGVAAISLGACQNPMDAERTVNGAPELGPPAAASVQAAGTVTTAWSVGPGGVAVAVDAADNVFTARWDYNPAGDIYVAKRDANGTLLWEVRYDNVDNTRHEVATWVATDPSGNVLVSGTIRSGYSNPVNANSLLMKFSPSGALLWRIVYDTPFDGSSTRKVLVDAAGNSYVLGLGTSPTGQRTTVRKFAPDGTLLWAWFDPAGVGSPINVKFSADGALVISARGIFGSINGYAKVSLDGSTIWTLAGVRSLTVGDIAGDAAGNAYLINGNYTTGNGSLLRKVGPGGAMVWERSLVLAGMRVEVGSDNAPVVSGFPNSGTPGAAFAKADANGNVLWTNLDADGPGVALLAHGMLRLDASNNAYLAASTMSQMGVTKVLSTGVADWTALIPYGYAVDLAFGTLGRVFVVGGTTARLDQQVTPPPPTNTPPAVSIVALTSTSIRVGQSVTMQATFADPDVGDGPWGYIWRWGNGTTSGTWASPGTYSATRTFSKVGTFYVKVRVTDARGASTLSNEVKVTVR
jgi:PKD domain